MDAVSRDEALAPGLLALHRMPLDTPEPELLRRAIDLAEAVTGSRVGYVHYVNDDQETLELAMWSTATIAHCSVVNDRHYPITTAGIWADTFRTRSPRIHNDYPSTPNKRGLPEGHVTLTRHLGVAVIEDDAVRLLLGVGNKRDPYDERDVEVAQQVADETWMLIDRLRAMRGATDALGLLRSQHGPLRLCTWQWDPETDAVTWGQSVTGILGARPGDPGFASWRPLLDELDLDSRELLRSRLASEADNDVLDLSLSGVDAGYGARAFQLSGGWTLRPTGRGEIMQGVLSDTSVLVELDTARHAAEHDPLTGMLNRTGLIARLTRRLDARRMRASDEFALHFVDLDRFKPVNDTLGHLVGDAVLRECAHRIVTSVRSSDIAARFGGDEFVVVQGGGPTDEEIAALAHELIAELSRPINVGPLEVAVGASIGVSRSSDSLPGLDALLLSADRALYEAKARQCGVVIARPGTLHKPG